MSGWKIPKDALEPALSMLLEVPSRHGVEASEYIKFERHKDNVVKLSLAAEMSGCSYVSAEAGCPLNKPIFIDRRMFEPFVTAGKDLSPEHYTLKVNDAQVIVKHGHRQGTYTSNKSARGYEKAPSISSKQHHLSEDMASLLECARHIAVDDPVAPHLSCVYVFPEEGGLRVLSANAHIFFSGKVVTSKPISLKNAALPLPLIDAIKAENIVSLLYSDKIAMLQFSCGSLWHPVKSEARKKFPSKRVLSMIEAGKKGETLLRIGSSTLYDCASRASSYVSAISSDNPPLKLETKKGDMEVRILCSATGVDFKESIKLTKPSKGDVLIDWPLSAILPILDYSRKAGEAKITRDPDGRTCFISGKIDMLIGRPAKQAKAKKSKKKSKDKE